MLHGTIRNDDFQRNTVLQCWNNVVTIGNSVATMLQRCCAKSRRSESSRVIGGFHVYVIAAMLVNGKQKIAHQLVFFCPPAFSRFTIVICVSRDCMETSYITFSRAKQRQGRSRNVQKSVRQSCFFFTNQKKGVLHVQSCWFANQIYCCFLPFSLSAYHLYGNFGEKFPSNGTGIIFWH